MRSSFLGLGLCLVLTVASSASTPSFTTNGLRLWLRADSITNAVDGGYVNAWTDSSGHGIDLVQSGSTVYQPRWYASVYDGQPALHFDGNDTLFRDSVLGSELGMPSNGTLFVVMKTASADTRNTILGWGTGDNRYYLHSTYDGLLTFQHGAPANGAFWYEPPGWDDTWHRTCVRRTGDTANTLFDTEWLGDLPIGSALPTNASQRLYVGGDPYGNRQTAYLHALLVYDRALSDAECLEVIRAHGPVTLYVDADSTGPVAPYVSPETAAANIQDAVNAARPGDTVRVYSGVYESGVAPTPGGTSGNRLCISNAITVVSVEGPHQTVIRGMSDGGTTGPNAVRCVYLDGGARLEGFTLVGGFTDSPGGAVDTSGGGAYVVSGVVARCVVEGCGALAGGGLYLEAGAVAENCLVVGNDSSGNGGGLFLAGGGRTDHSTVVDNSAGGSGGGVYLDTAGTVRNSISYLNSATAGNNWYGTGGGTFSSVCTTPTNGLPNATGCFENDPAFLDVAAGNYRLSRTSLCVDVATALSGIAVDVDGAPRSRDGDGDGNIAPDLGCYERVVRQPFVVTEDDGGYLYVAEWNVASNSFVGFRLLDQLRKSEGVAAYSRGAAILDVNGDGHDDILATRAMAFQSHGFLLYLNDGTNGFVRSPLGLVNVQSEWWGMDMTAGDFNNDGLADFIAQGDTGSITVFLGDGTGRFAGHVQDGLERRSRGLDTADFDGDGNLDLVRASYASGNLRFYAGHGDGTFAAYVQLADLGSDPYGVTAGDFDGDGKDDIIANSNSGGDVWFLKGNGDGTFGAPVPVPALDFNNLGGLDSYDYDGDGDLDVVAATYSSRSLLYFEGDGSGTKFAPAVTVGGTANYVFGISTPPLPGLPGIPLASLQPAAQTVALGNAASLDGSGSADADGALAAHFWDFGDGNTSGTISGAPSTTSHLYSAEGRYRPRLQVTDSATNNAWTGAEVLVAGVRPTMTNAVRYYDEADAVDGRWPVRLEGTAFASDPEGLVAFDWDIRDEAVDDFEDGTASRWRSFTGDWAATEALPIQGAWSLRQANTSASRSRALFDKEVRGDFIMETDFQFRSGGGQEVIFVFGAYGSSDGYEALLRGRGVNDLRFDRLGGGAQNNVPLGFTPQPGQTYHFKVVRRGGWLQFYIDDRLLFRHYEPFIISGYCGMSTYRTEVVVDNFQVRSLRESSYDARDRFSDDFEDGDSEGWSSWEGTWTVSATDPIDGSNSLHQSHATTSRARFMYNKIMPPAVKASADVRMLAGSGEEVMFHLGTRSDNSRLECIFRGRGLNDVLVIRRVDGGEIGPDSLPLPFAIGLNQTYHLRVEWLFDEVTFWIGTNELARVGSLPAPGGLGDGLVGLCTYRTAARFDNVQVESLAGLSWIDQTFDTGTNYVDLVAMDAVGQSVTGNLMLVMQPGDKPVADANGPYVVDEQTGDAQDYHWLVPLDGSGSWDPTSPQERLDFTWELGMETFDGTVQTPGRWVTSSAVAQNDQLEITGDGGWGRQYAFTKSAVERHEGVVFEAKVLAPSSCHAMVGFKNTSATYSYSHMPHAIYFHDNDNIYIYEGGSQRALVQPYTPGEWYDVRIVLKASAGARYYLRASNAGAEWTLLYDSTYNSDIELLRGADVNNGTLWIDDLRDMTTGMNPSWRFCGPGSRTISLVVTDPTGVSDTNSTTVTALPSAPPVADAGGNQMQYESNAVDRVWTFAFDASGSSDDHGILRYEWDWDFDGAFAPSGDTGANQTHSWTDPGVYTVVLRVTDHAWQTDVDTSMVTIVAGNPPVADAGGPYVVDEFTAPANAGAWPLALDGSGSYDNESTIVQYVWDLGVDDFDSLHAFDEKWISSPGVTVSNSMMHMESTGQYLYTRDLFTRERGLRAEARVRVSNTAGESVFGFKRDNTGTGWNDWAYGLAFDNGWLARWEYGSVGNLGVNYTPNTWYDFRVELKEGSGARYYYKLATNSVWTLLHESTYQSETTFYRGYRHHTGATDFDCEWYRENAAGESPNYREYRPGSNTVSLTVWDQALESDSSTASIVCLANQPPVADAGTDHYGTETNCTDGIWWFSFSAAGSSDDYGIYRYEWDWNYDGNFEPSGDTGQTVMHAFSPEQLGTNTIAVRVTDHVLQQDIDTAVVILTKGAPPTAEAGSNVVVELGWPLPFDGTGSSDDVAVSRYEWDFGDGTTGAGHAPLHIYRTATNYTVTLVVYDAVEQPSAPDTMVVTVVTSTPPTAVAGGPYYAGAGGPPAYFDGRSSTDNGDTNVVQGVARYLWDVDIWDDSDGNGNPADDVDLLGPTPFHVYPTVGIYTAKLSVADAVDQWDSDQAIVFVETNRAPDVICVPLHGDPSSQHLTYTGHVARLKGIVRDAGTLTYQWDFGDGSSSTVQTVANKYAIEATHAYTGQSGKPFTARLMVWDSQGVMGEDSYPLVIRPDTMDTRANIAVDEGLWFLHKDQNKTGGNWNRPYSGYHASATASALQALQINGHRIDGNPGEDPYVETVRLGFMDLFNRLTATDIGPQPAGDPDTNANGIGVGVNSARTGYESGMALDAIASSRSLLSMAPTGPTNVKHRYFFDIATDMVDQHAWGQRDSGAGQGGWRYRWNDSASDNSASQWAAIGLLAAQDILGINIPDFVRTENQIWLNYSYNPAGYFGYDDNIPEWNWYSVSPSALVQMAVNGTRTTNAFWRTAEDYIAERWPIESDTSKLYYGQYAFVKAMRLARPRPVVTLNKTGLDWFYDPNTGMQQRLVGQQASDGSWYGYAQQNNGYGLNYDLSTSWAISMLTPSLFTQPPVAVITAPGLWGYGVPLQFSAANSFHIEASRNIVKYEWDFDGDGIYDLTSTDPDDPNAAWTYPDPTPGVDGDPPAQVIVTLRVTDDNVPAQTDITTHTITVAEPPHAPYADADGPYQGVTGFPMLLDGSGSYDIDPTDHITLYEWDLNLDDTPDLVTSASTTTHVFAATGQFNIALRVHDNGVFNGGTNLVSAWDYAEVTIEANLPPVADAGGPYVVLEDEPLELNGSGSHDPNALTPIDSYAWDLDNDGTPDATVPVFTQSWDVAGVVTVSLVVSDSQLADTNTTTVTVLPVNDPPTFTMGPDQVVFWDAGPQSISGWATGISAGPADEQGQALWFVCMPDRTGLFVNPPAVSTNGILTYAPNSWGHGTATVSVVLHDAGGTDNGGLDASGPQSFTIFVNGDTDNDGIHDRWEGIHFPNLDVADGTSDYDGDGFADRNESLADTNPTDSNSLLRIEALVPTNGGWNVTWQSVTTRVYTLLRATTDLQNAEFVVVTSGVPGLVDHTTAEDSDTNRVFRFYRVQTHLPENP